MLTDSPANTDTPAGALASDTFTWRDTTYTVAQLYDVESESLLRIEVDSAVPDDRSRVVLNVDGYLLPLDRAATKHGNRLEWSLPVTLNTGDEVDVSLVQIYNPPQE